MPPQPTPWIPLAACPKPCLPKNLAALRAIQPELVSCLESQASREDIWLLPDPSGYHACRKETPSGPVWIHGTHRMGQEAQHLISLISQGFATTRWLAFVFATGMGLVLPGVNRFLQQKLPGQAKGVVCLEEDPGLLYAGLCSYDLTEVLYSGRFLFALGPDLIQAVKDLYETHHLETLNDQQIGFFTGSILKDRERIQTYSTLIQAIQSHHTTQRAAYLDLLKKAEITWASPPKAIRRVWTQINDERAGGGMLLGLVEGFRQAGLEARALCFHDQFFTRLYRCAYDFFRFQPDLYLCINHSSNYTLPFAKEVPIPRVVWFVDEPINTVPIPFHPRDQVIAIASSFLDAIAPQGIPPLGVVQAGCPAILTPPPKQGEWRHEVSYVGSVIDNRALIASLSSTCRAWIDEIIDAQLAAPRRNLDDLVSQNPANPAILQAIHEHLASSFSKATYMGPAQMLLYFLYTEANSRRRVQILDAIPPGREFGLYGPPDWLGLLPPTRKNSYKGPIISKEALHQLYRSSMVNLSINSLQGFGFINPRVFETSAAGGFLLAEYVPGLETVFEKDAELLWFERLDEIGPCLECAWADEEKREAMIRRAQSKLLHNHTYTHRARTILGLQQPHM